MVAVILKKTFFWVSNLLFQELLSNQYSIQLLYFLERTLQLIGLLIQSNKFISSPIIHFIIITIVHLLDCQVDQNHLFKNGQLSHRIFINITIKRLFLLSPEVVNGLVNVTRPSNLIGRQIKFSLIWSLAPKIAKSSFLILLMWCQLYYKIGLQKLALSIHVSIAKSHFLSLRIYIVSNLFHSEMQ